MELSEYLSAVFLPPPSEGPTPRIYMGGISIKAELPGILDDIELPAYVQRGETPLPYLWLGAGDTTTQLHYDINCNFHALVSGRKRFLLFPPKQSAFLYPTSMFNWRRRFSQVALEEPDYKRFPRLERAEGYEAVLEDGDLLFLPSLWWHQVETITPTIAVNYWWGLNRYAHRANLLYVRELPLVWYSVLAPAMRWRWRRLKQALRLSR